LANTVHNTNLKHRGGGAVWCLKTTAVPVAVFDTKPRQMDKGMAILQLCCWKFLHKETL